jgi:hypothetical protein
MRGRNACSLHCSLVRVSRISRVPGNVSNWRGHHELFPTSPPTQSTMASCSLHRVAVVVLLCVSNFITYSWFQRSDFRPSSSSSSQHGASRIVPTTSQSRSKAYLDLRRTFSFPSPSYSLAFEESFGFFDDVHNSTWRHYRKAALKPRLYRNESFPDHNSHIHGSYNDEEMSQRVETKHGLSLTSDP